MRSARRRSKRTGTYLLNFAYFQEENYAKVRDIQKILLETWPKKRYWFSLAGAYTELGEDDNLIAAYDAAYTTRVCSRRKSEFVTMAQLYLQARGAVQGRDSCCPRRKWKSGIVQRERSSNYRSAVSGLDAQPWKTSKAIPALQGRLPL